MRQKQQTWEPKLDSGSGGGGIGKNIFNGGVAHTTVSRRLLLPSPDVQTYPDTCKVCLCRAWRLCTITGGGGDDGGDDDDYFNEGEDGDDSGDGFFKLYIGVSAGQRVHDRAGMI